MKGLYLVATPIGNLGDMSYRAIETLKASSLILCEDTRQFSKLATRYEIKTPRKALHEHNERAILARIVAQLERGEVISLVSDAGTPLISDPGYPLVRAVREAGIPLTPIPGPCAFIAALSASGFEPDEFHFAGFLPVKPGRRRSELERLLALGTTIALYESPHRIEKTLTDLFELSPEREICIAREISKIHEEFLFGTASKLLSQIGVNPPKGEIVLLIRKAESTR